MSDAVYDGNVWHCTHCDDTVRRHSIDTCQRCGGFMSFQSGTMPEMSAKDIERAQRANAKDYAKAYYNNVTKPKRKREK